jgi:asparagine synthase (glutamine-hydrolysing)
MCGIAGIFHSDPHQPIDPQLLVNMAAIQYHRGPDGFGWKTLDDLGVGFSHARLSIIDLDENRAPPALPVGGRTAAAGPQRRVLRLQAHPHRPDLARARFRTKSDSEMVLHLYPRLGLDGMLPSCAASSASPSTTARKTA